MSEVKQYAERDLMEMDCAGNHYCRHVSAMTREQLHSKSDIAAELGWRDMQIAKLTAERDALAAETNWWKPERCPVTNRPFFLWIEHPSGGMVPTYGGPYDSYTIPTVDSDGEFCCERYDHDEGAWVDSECLSVRLTDDREPAVDDAYLNSVRADTLTRIINTGEFSNWVNQGLQVWVNKFNANSDDQLRAGKDGE